MKSAVHVKSIPGTTTKGMKHVRGCLEESSPDTAILHFGTNNLKNNESAEDIATDIETSMWNLALQPLRTLYLDYHDIYGHQTWQGDNLPRGAPTHKVTQTFDHAVM